MLSCARIIVFTSVTVLSACANFSDFPKFQNNSATSATSSISTQGIDGTQCIGTTPASVPGLNTHENNALQQKAQYETGKGGVCTAKSFITATPFNVYRVYDEKKPWSIYGSWWAMNRPTGSKEDYRQKNAICKEWSNLDRLISCQVKTGTEIILGTTQSVTCEDGTSYPKTATLQVYIPNDQKNGILYVENCHEEGQWP